MTKIIDIVNKNREGVKKGIYSVCCAQPLVIEAAIRQAINDDSVVLIEATANQVNQFGGYTSMQAVDFVCFVENIAKKLMFPMENVILGGDHLGPVCWVNENSEQAMEKAKVLIASYVSAGFKKIHLDTSMRCNDDPAEISDETVAQRAALLCEVAEKTAIQTFGESTIVYIIGTEVPPPGGATEKIDELELTPTYRVENTLALHLRAFKNKKLLAAWQRVIGIVVQPGVEFDHTSVINYDSAKAQNLSHYVKQISYNIAYEAHSTDYQTPDAYTKLIKDHFAILKVGPQLTFAMREALFALSHIEQHYIPANQCANLPQILESEMLKNPKYWEKFYQVEDNEALLYRRFSYSDRIRYYWNTKKVEQAVAKLLSNLTKNAMPLPLVSQYMPEQYSQIRSGVLANCPRELTIHKIMQVTRVYAAACYQTNL